MISAPRLPSALSWFIVLVVVLCAVYTGLRWTPTSYALALKQFGVSETGLVAGKPRPIRSDEWVVWTPFVQAAVNNDFQRINETSPYREDLRNFNAVPLLDWALPFKPQYWPFFFADPALAFSFSHAIFIGMCLVGYAVLFRVLGFPGGWAAGGSLILFFTTYAQYWWTTTGPLLAIFPWLLVVATAPLRPVVKAPLTAYLVAFWLLSHTYPPIVVSLGIAGAVALAAFRPEVLRPANLLALGAGAAVGAGLAFLYLHEPAAVMAKTIYPGHRESVGGTMEPLRWVAQFFPQLVTRAHESLIPILNVCEAATGGSYLLVLVLLFTDHKALAARLVQRSPEGRRLRWTLGVLLAGSAIFTLWMLAPVPASIGRFLLLDRVPPGRVVFANGILLLLIAFTLLAAAPVRITLVRVLVAALVTLGAWALFKAAPLLSVISADWRDFVVLVPLAALLAVPRLRQSASHSAMGLVGAAALANIVATADFNPIQSADPIFHRPRTAITEELDRMVAEHPRGWLVIPGFPGATLNGWGYPAISHVTIAPRLDFFRERFPDMDEASFQDAFNRYARVNVTAVAAPTVPQPDSVDVPASAFLLQDRPVPVVQAGTETIGRHPYGGFLDSTGKVAKGAGREITLRGWGLLDRGGELMIRSSVTPAAMSAKAMLRPDVAAALNDPRLLYAGFQLTLTFDGDIPDGAPLPTVCVVSRSPAFGAHLLQTPGAPENCRDLAQ